ncbi:hypothetical protein C2E31_05185 [Rhodopirellula baltica]|nr:hypothetical protein C2E31_05185 [Rhodopirellula baltica]
MVLAALVALAPLSELALSDLAYAQQPNTRQASPETEPGWNLRWRKSSQIAPAPVHVPQHDVFAEPARTASPAANQAAANSTMTIVRRTGVGQVANAAYASPGYGAEQAVRPASHQVASDFQDRNAFASQVNRGAIQQTAHTASGQSGLGQPQRGPVANYRRDAAPIQQNQLQERLPRPEDFFNDPFADGTQAAPAQARLAAVPIPVPDPQTDDAAAPSGFGLPDSLPGTAEQTDDTPANPFRNRNLPDPSAPAADQIPLPAPELPMPSQSPGNDSSLRGLLSDPSIAPEQPAEEVPAPQPEQILPPADMQSPGDLGNDGPDDDFRFTPPMQSDRSDNGQPSPSDLPSGNAFPNRTRENLNDRFNNGAYNDTSMLRSNELSCEDFRDRIKRETIDTISLDPSPPFRPDLFDPEDYQKQREKFERRQSVRAWRNLGGEEVARGKLVGLAYEQVIIESETGSRQELPVNRLSEGDLGYLAENWGLPKECLVEQVAYTPRNWAPITMTYKASNACSKPRYFEEVNLERYGHSAGPLLQPVVSSAHFFANIAVLPYKMGIHPPDECVYALGYYRPGNCAPWIVPPVPVSARGALAQGAFMSGAFWLIP